MSDFETKYALTGEDKGAKATFNDVGASIARAAANTDKASKSVADLAAKLDRSAAAAGKAAIESNKSALAMSAIGQGASRAAQQIPGVGSAMAAISGGPMIALAAGVTAVSAGFIGAAKKGIDFADSLNDLSDRLGVPVETLSRLAPVAELGGTSLESLSVILGKFAAKVSVGDKSIQALGLSTTDAVGAMIEIADKVKGATSQTEAIAIAQAAYGKQWQELMPILKMGGDVIRETMGGAAVVTAEMAAQSAKVKDEFMLLQNQMLATSVTLGQHMVPALQKMVELASQFFVAMNGGADAAQLGADNWSAEASRLKAQLADPNISLWQKTKLTSQLKDAERKSRDYALTELSRRVGQESGPGSMGGYRGETPPPAAVQIESPEQIAAREAAAKKEIEFQRDLQWKISELTADADSRELVAIQNKYTKLFDAHKAYGDSLLLIRQAQDAELQAYYMKQNFAGLAAQRDSDGEQYKSHNIVDRVRQSGIGSVDGNQWSYFVQNGNESIQKTVNLSTTPPQKIRDSYEEATIAAKAFGDQSRALSNDVGSQWTGVSESITETVASGLAPALLDAFTRPRDALEQLGDVGTKILADLATQLLEVGIKWALLSLIAGGTGGEGPGGFVKFLTKSIGGHADGTRSSPGGLKYLGEQGPEMVTTPLGSRYMASYGLYQVPAGTRVEKATAGPATFSPQITIQGASDPIQTAEIVDRRLREMFSVFQQEEYRTRQS